MPRERPKQRSSTIGFVLNVGVLAGCIALIIFAVQPELALEAVLVRAFLVFVVSVLVTTFVIGALQMLRRARQSSATEDRVGEPL